MNLRAIFDIPQATFNQLLSLLFHNEGKKLVLNISLILRYLKLFNLLTASKHFLLLFIFVKYGYFHSTFINLYHLLIVKEQKHVFKFIQLSSTFSFLTLCFDASIHITTFLMCTFSDHFIHFSMNHISHLPFLMESPFDQHFFFGGCKTHLIDLRCGSLIILLCLNNFLINTMCQHIMSLVKIIIIVQVRCQEI